MNKKLLAPLQYRQVAEDLIYFAALSEAGEWVRRATTPTLYADLPTNPKEGWQIPIIDSNTATFHAVIGGLGGNRVLGYFDGTSWRVGG